MNGSGGGGLMVGIFSGRGGWADFRLMGGIPPYPQLGKTLNN